MSPSSKGSSAPRSFASAAGAISGSSVAPSSERPRRLGLAEARFAELANPLARLGALLRRHALPALPVADDALALALGQLLELLPVPENAGAALDGQPLEPIVGLLQLVSARFRQLRPALEVRQQPLALRRRQLPESLEVFPRRLSLLGRHRAPVTVPLEHTLALLRGHLLPAVEVALDDDAFLR